VLVTPKKLEQASNVCLATRQAESFSRAFPVVRHLISIPAGIVRMISAFSSYDDRGLGDWVLDSGYLGDKAYHLEPSF